MNFLAHALVAARLAPGDAEMALGAVLPDLGPMADVRFEESQLNAALRRGVRCHRLADTAFHGDRAFSDGSRNLRRAAEGQGLARGPSRAVGHAGWELLLDGYLIGHSAVEEVFVAALGHAETVAATLPFADQHRWRDLVATALHHRWWTHYDEPEIVAQALQRRLAGRPRLAFPPSEVLLVTAALREAQPAVAGHAGSLFQRVLDAVASSDTDRPA